MLLNKPYTLLYVVFIQTLANCAEMSEGKEFSLVKAMINFKKRSREMMLLIRKNSAKEISKFIKNLTVVWEKFAIKDRYRKKRISTLQTLKQTIT